jgi:hypothetical protein
MPDVNKVVTVIKDGVVYDPAEIEKALGILPRQIKDEQTMD